MAPPTTTTSPPASATFLGRLVDLDTTISLRLHTLFLPVPRLLLKALEVAGDGRLWLPIPISLLLLLSTATGTSSFSRSPLLAGLVAGLVLDLLLVGLVKHLVRRPRPVYNKGMSVTFAADHWSFPSGHSSRAFLVAAFLAGDGGLRRWLGGGEVAFLWAAATSASRVLLGRHFVLDVVAGACLGVLEAWVTSRFLRLLCGHRSFPVC